MVRTQLYMADSQYEYVKKSAESQKMSYAAYMRILVDKDEASKKKNLSLQEKYPFIGMFKGGRNDSDNDEIDAFLVNQHGH